VVKKNQGFSFAVRFIVGVQVVDLDVRHVNLDLLRFRRRTQFGFCITVQARRDRGAKAQSRKIIMSLCASTAFAPFLTAVYSIT
jgi:hypothetical protein